MASADTLNPDIDTPTEQAQSAECDRLRDRIRENLLAALSSDGILINSRMVELTIQGYEKNKLAEYGATDMKTQLDWLKTAAYTDIPRTIHEARQFSRHLQEAILRAKADGALNENNVQHIKEKLSQHNGSWIAVKAFFETEKEDSLRQWTANWKSLADKTKHLKALRAKHGLHASDLPELAKADEAQKTGGVLERLKILDAAIIAIEMREHSKTGLYAKAMAAMQPALSSGAMTESQVQRNLKRIYAKYKGAALEHYIKNILPGRVRQWMVSIAAFRTQKNRCEKLAIKTISEDAFFKMDHGERTEQIILMASEAKKAENPEAHPILGKIEDLIDAEDWAGAQAEHARASAVTLSDHDRQRLFVLGQTIDANAYEETTSQPQSLEDDLRQKEERVMHALESLPEAMRDTYKWPLQSGGTEKWKLMRRIMTWTYNVKWASQHGFVPDEEAFQSIKEKAEHDTRRINEEGHRATGVEMIDLKEIDKSKQVMARTFNGGRTRGATYIKYSKHTLEDTKKVLAAELDNERKTYWELGIPDGEGITLKKMLEINDEIHPLIKSLRAAETAMGLGDRSIGDPIRKKAA